MGKDLYMAIVRQWPLYLYHQTHDIDSVHVAHVVWQKRMWLPWYHTLYGNCDLYSTCTIHTVYSNMEINCNLHKKQYTPGFHTGGGGPGIPQPQFPSHNSSPPQRSCMVSIVWSQVLNNNLGATVKAGMQERGMKIHVGCKVRRK